MPRVQVLQVRRFDFADDKDGTRRVRGCKVTYSDGTKVDKSDEIGTNIVEMCADYAMFEKLGPVPGYYEIDYSFSGKGKPRICDIRPVNNPAKA